MPVSLAIRDKKKETVYLISDGIRLLGNSMASVVTEAEYPNKRYGKNYIAAHGLEEGYLLFFGKLNLYSLNKKLTCRQIATELVPYFLELMEEYDLFDNDEKQLTDFAELRVLFVNKNTIITMDPGGVTEHANVGISGKEGSVVEAYIRNYLTSDADAREVGIGAIKAAIKKSAYAHFPIFVTDTKDGSTDIIYRDGSVTQTTLKQMKEEEN